jgi:hypothetical protein
MILDPNLMDEDFEPPPGTNQPGCDTVDVEDDGDIVCYQGDNADK